MSYLVHTRRPGRDDLWTTFTHKELAVEHADGCNALPDLTSTVYEIALIVGGNPELRKVER